MSQLTPEDKRRIKRYRNRIAKFELSRDWHKAHGRIWRASVFSDLIDDAERTINEIETGLYQGKVKA